MPSVSPQTTTREADDLRLYAVLRSDIAMSQGKCIAQAGHAFVDALINAMDTPDGRSYASLKPGTKITLDGGSYSAMMQLLHDLAVAGIPHVTIIDSGHIELPDFDGSPVMTAIGIGPLPRAAAPRALRRLKLWSGRPLAHSLGGQMMDP